MIWIPVELILEIFRAVKKLIGRCDFKLEYRQSMLRHQEYYDNLLAFALSSKEWTAIAQAELFRDIILKNRSKTGQFLKLVRENEQFRSHGESTISVRFGGADGGVYDAEGLDDELDEIALYCPNIVEASCYGVRLRLEYFRNMKKLDKLNLVYGLIQPPPAIEARSQRFTLPITVLSLVNVIIVSSIDPSSLPLVRSLHLSSTQTCKPIRLLLPNIASLHVRYMSMIADIDKSIQQSTSITSLSIYEDDIARVNEASRKAIKEKIVELRLQVMGDDNSGDSVLTSILAGSKAMKKVILDGIYVSVQDQLTPKDLETLRVLKEGCKTNQIELWRENFDVGNGVVDLEK